MLKVGCVSYINALPLILPFRFNKIFSPTQFHLDIPRTLNQLLQGGKLDMALTSSVEYLDQNYDLLPGFGIVGHHRVLSVNLYTQKPIQELEGRTIGLTHHSATSVALLKTLCHHAWKVSPNWEMLDRQRPQSHYDGLLLIGDEALEKPTLAGFQTIDLAEAWSQLTALPFVFAVFSVKKETSLSHRKTFAQDLESALQWSESHPSAIEEEALKQCLTVGPEKIHEYYQVLKYRLGAEELRSLNLFKQLKEDVPKI